MNFDHRPWMPRRTSAVAFLVSFSFGTILLVTFQLTDSEAVFVLGFFYVIAAIVANLIVLTNNLLRICFYKAGRKSLLIGSALLLLNLPIAYYYFNIVTNF